MIYNNTKYLKKLKVQISLENKYKKYLINICHEFKYILYTRITEQHQHLYSLLFKQDYISITFYVTSFYIFINNIVNNLFLLTLYNYNFQPYYKNIKYNQHYHKTKTNNHKFVNNMLKHGLKIRYVNIYSKMFFLFYQSFFYFDDFFSKLFPLYITFYNLSKSNIIFYIIDYFYQLLYNQYNYIFFVKIASFPRKLKKNKKTKKKYNVYVSYLKPINRFKWMLKQLITSNICFNFNKFVNRLSHAFLSILLSPDKNLIKDQQLRIYKYILKNKKNY